MIFLDANYFLRYLTRSVSENESRMSDAARKLFVALEDGRIEVTTNEVVLHEVFYVLTSKNAYAQTPAVAIEKISYIISLPGFRFPSGMKRRYLRALEIWANHNVLGFADSLIAATVEELDYPLATFDTHFNRLGSVTFWEPDEAE